ncbi:MAG TPA: hypothetical protein VG476_07565 [Acidimicrobiales bacterium]|nr:hypothetical protein [Acidimicrobiales bacterium]
MKPEQQRWGSWTFDRRTMTLDFAPYSGRAYEYSVLLDKCITCAQVLDSIAQVAGKTWATPEVVGDLVAALDDLLGLQTNYCSNGVDRGVQKPLALVRARTRRVRGAGP